MTVRDNSGFSLVELAVVLVILGIIVTMGMDIGQNALRGSARIATQERLALIKESLDAYAQRNGYLPCPADPAMLPSNAGFAVESRNATAGLGCIASGDVTQVSSVWYGMVPVRNLGLDDSYATDSWGNKLLYAVSSQHIGDTSTGWTSYAINAGTIAVRSGTRVGSNYIIITNDTTGAPNTGATYVVLSHGRNQRGAYPLNGTAVAVACGADATLIDVENCDRSNATFYDSDYNEGGLAATQFDDFVVWGTNATLRNPLQPINTSCPGSCETWCAPCESARTSTAPGIASRLCAKFVTQNCQAVCIWESDTSPCP